MHAAKGIALIDIDGTLLNPAHRLHYVEGKTFGGVGDKKLDQWAWDHFVSAEEMAKDPPFPHAKEGLDAIEADWNIIFLTGRNLRLLEVTQNSLEQKLGRKTVLGENLFMRGLDNKDAPTVYKRKQINRILCRPENADPRENYIRLLAADDDPYMWPTYREFGAIVVKAPDCWSVLYPNAGELPPEEAWRK